MFKKKELTRLGDILVSKGLITPAQLDLAIKEQSRRNRLLDPSDSTAVVAPIGEILIELGFIDQLQLKRGLNWQARLRHASIAMALCAPFMMFAPSIARAAPTLIEAENYVSMHGVITENTTDIGGGKNVASVTTGEWTAYRVDVPVSGNYKFTYRVATYYPNTKLVLKSDKDVDLAPAVDIPKTGGWQNWTDIEQTVRLEKGQQTIKIYGQSGGFNINWFKMECLEPIPEPIAKLIEAESYSSMSGVVQENTADVGGGKNVGHIAAGDWMNYENADLTIPKTDTYKISYRVASASNGGILQLKNSVTGAVLDSVPVPNTKGWQTWVTVERIVTLEQGALKLQVYAEKGNFNFNWFKIENAESPPLVSPPQVSSSSSSSSSVASSTSSVSSSSSSSSSTPAVSSSSWSSSSAAAHVAGPVVVTWMAPDKRENGAALYVEELGGYEIRYKKVSDARYTYMTINDPWTQSYKFDWLEGDYIFQIAAFDQNGIYSPFVDIRRE